MNDKDLSVNQRIKFLIEQYSKMTQRAFSEKIGISQSAVSSLFSQRENRPGLEMLQKIAIAFPEISMDWLLIGRGPMLQNEPGSTVDTLTIDAQIDASELRIAQEFVTMTGAKLARQKQMMELLDKESMRLTTQKADIAEKQAAGHATPEDAAEYQQLNAQWLQVLEEKKELSGSIEFGTTLLAEQQAEYIELVNQRLGIQSEDATLQND